MDPFRLLFCNLIRLVIMYWSHKMCHNGIYHRERTNLRVNQDHIADQSLNVRRVGHETSPPRNAYDNPP